MTNPTSSNPDETYQLIHAIASDNHILPSSPGNIRLDISDYDQTLTLFPYYTTLTLFFHLPSSVTSTSRSRTDLVTALKSAYEHTLSQIQVFAGKLYVEPDTKRGYILRKQSDYSLFGVRHLDHHASTFPSLDQWRDMAYPDSLLHTHRALLIPPGLPAIGCGDQVNGMPMSAAQVNFIPGSGVVLVGVWEHSQGDAKTFDCAMALWARITRCILRGETVVPRVEVSYDRGHFDGRATEGGVTDEEVEVLKSRVKGCVYYPVEKHVAFGVKGETLEFPTNCRNQLYYFSRENLERLKRVCSPVLTSSDTVGRTTEVDGEGREGKEVGFVSTYDCLAALIWLTITKARAHIHPEWTSSDTTAAPATTALTHAVNIRDRFGVPNTYIGNGGAFAVTDPIPISTFLTSSSPSSSSEHQATTPSALQIAAAAVRASIQSINERTVPDIATLIRAFRDRGSTEFLGVGNDVVFGRNVFGSSWRNLRAFESAVEIDRQTGEERRVGCYDFGFGTQSDDGSEGGKPLSVRAMLEPVDGLFTLYPASEPGGIDVLLRMEPGCQERVLADEGFRAFCKVRG